MSKIEFVKPVLHIDKFFKVADYLITSDDYELNQLGRVMRSTYEAQMVEMEERECKPETDIENYNPSDCKSGVCD